MKNQKKKKSVAASGQHAFQVGAAMRKVVQQSPWTKRKGSYWCVAVYTPAAAAAADRRVPVVEVDGRQTLLWKTVAKAAAQTPRTLAAFCLMVVQRYLHTCTQDWC